MQSEWRGDAKALARAACAAGRRGLFDIVRCEYAASAFVIASGDAAGWDRARNKPQVRRMRPRALRIDVLQAGVAPVSCFRPVFSCYGQKSGRDRNGAGRTRFLLSPCDLRERSPASGCTQGPVFLLLFTGKQAW